MAEVVFKRVENSSSLNNIPIVDGSFYVTKDGKTFIDYGNERVAVGGTPDAQMSDVSTNSVQNKTVKEYVDDVAADVSALSSELKYDVEDDGYEIMTGITYFSKPVYLRRYTFSSLNSEGTFSKNLGFTLSDVTIYEMNGVALSNSANWFPFPMGDWGNSQNFGIRYYLADSNSTIQVITANANFSKAYINVYYIYND